MVIEDIIDLDNNLLLDEKLEEPIDDGLDDDELLIWNVQLRISNRNF